MSPAEILSDDIAEAARDLRARQQPFVFATIVRTVGLTAAKPGAKALIGADGTILQGFLGGGCTRGAVKRAATAAIQTGQPQLISVAPEELLDTLGIVPGTESDGITYAKNGCPSRGTVDIFIEPCLPMKELVVLGASPVANAMAALAPQFHWSVQRKLDALVADAPIRVIVLATQGQGDLPALEAALALKADHVAFVGSRKKFAALATKLRAKGLSEGDIARVSAPAGLDIGAVTPEEIALSILAELIQLRRDMLKPEDSA
ncbi:MAG: XdhC family protein [Pseudomonadota bacterium]